MSENVDVETGEVIVETGEKSENTKALDILTQTSHELHKVDFISKAMAQEYVKAAMREVAYGLAENNMKYVLEIEAKTRAVEEYIKSKVHHQLAKLVTQNTIAGARVEIKWEIGEWLDKHLADPHVDILKEKDKVTGQIISRGRIDSTPGKIVYWLDDLEISSWQSDKWQDLYRYFSSKDDLLTWITETYLFDEIDGKENELYFSRVLAYIRGDKEKAKQVKLNMSPAMNILYKAMQIFQKAIAKYINWASQNATQKREAVFFIGEITKMQKGLESAKRIIGERA